MPDNQNPKPAALTLLKNADANLEMLHLHPEAVQPLRLADMRAYRELLTRIAARVQDLTADLEGN